eukprot:scaffold55400_cov35-Attheya_sp.AAC.1
MSPPRNDSPFAADIRHHVLSHQTTMNIFDPDNGEYGNITFDILSEISIFDMESFLNPQYWNADEMFKSDMIIKNIDQANAANHLECIHSFEIVNHFKPSKDVPRSTSHHPTLTPLSAQKRLKVWGNYMRDTHGFEVRSVSTVPADKRSPSSFPLSPFVYTAPTNLENVLPTSEERSVRSSTSRRSDRRHRRQAKDNDSIGSQSTRDSTIPRSIQHSTANQDVNYHDEVALEAGLPDTRQRSSRIPNNQLISP